MIDEMIKYYEGKITMIDAHYANSQSIDHKLINYRIRKKKHVEQKDLLEDIIADLKRIKLRDSTRSMVHEFETPKGEEDTIKGEKEKERQIRIKNGWTK